MNVLQHTRDKLNLWLKQNRPDRSYRDTVLITPIQLAKSKSLFELINLIQIKESVVDFFLSYSHCQLRFCYVLKQRKPGILWIRCPFSHESGWVPLICHVLLTKHTSAGTLYSSTTNNLLDFFTNKKLSSIYRHELTVIYSQGAEEFLLKD